MLRTLNFVLSAAAILVALVWFRYQRALDRVHRLPGTRLLLDPLSPIMYLLPRIKGLGLGSNYTWDMKYSLYDRCEWDIHTLVGIFSGTPGYFVSNLNVIKQIAASRTVFVRPVDYYQALETFGPNIIITEGDQWKRQKRICAPAFSDKNNFFVWNTTTRLTDEMMETWAGEDSVSTLDACKEMVMPLALCVIAQAGFGQDVTLTDNAPPPKGHRLTFKKALSVVANNLFLPVILPAWAWNLRGSWRSAKSGYDEVLVNKAYIHEMIDLRRSPGDMKSIDDFQRLDLFSQLLDAHDEGNRLTSDELIGNIFVFLIAGHETTSHTLTFILGLLALYPEEQARLLQHIKGNRPESEDFTYNDLQKLTYLNAVINETLRLYPSAPLIEKRTSEDAQMNLSPGTSISVPARTAIRIHVAGVHYNPKYWDDPFEFLPSRFLDPKWNRDAFIPFSVGARSCIGRRFAETTMAAFLVRFLPQYRVSVDEKHFAPVTGESMVERRERFMKASNMLTLGPGELPLVFTRRG